MGFCHSFHTLWSFQSRWKAFLSFPKIHWIHSEHLYADCCSGTMLSTVLLLIQSLQFIYSPCSTIRPRQIALVEVLIGFIIRFPLFISLIDSEHIRQTGLTPNRGKMKHVSVHSSLNVWCLQCISCLFWQNHLLLLTHLHIIKSLYQQLAMCELPT